MTAPEWLNRVFCRLFGAGDLQLMRHHLLHSSAWVQHQRTAYGEEQIGRLWMAWFAAASPGTCTIEGAASGPGQSLHVLDVQPSNAVGPVRVGLWAWHNDHHLKRVICLPDTSAWTGALGLNEKVLLAQLPDPDPLVICDYDQQEHPGSVAVSPADLADLPPDVESVIARWWSLWRDMQLATIEQLYEPDAQIVLPGKTGPGNATDLYAHCAHWFASMQRRFCQPESVIVDSANPGSIAVLWNMEGDMQGSDGMRRVRLPVMDLMEIEADRIKRTVQMMDALALQKCLAS